MERKFEGAVATLASFLVLATLLIILLLIRDCNREKQEILSKTYVCRKGLVYVKRKKSKLHTQVFENGIPVKCFLEKEKKKKISKK